MKEKGVFWKDNKGEMWKNSEVEGGSHLEEAIRGLSKGVMLW